MSERFLLPDEALPSEPPPPPEPPLGRGHEAPAVGAATAHIPIPEQIKLLNAALPTPESFEPIPLVIPKATPLPHIDVDLADDGEQPEGHSDAEPLAAPAASAPAARERRPTAGRQIANAIALFLILLSVSAVAILLCADFLFR